MGTFTPDICSFHSGGTLEASNVGNVLPTTRRL